MNRNTIIGLSLIGAAQFTPVHALLAAFLGEPYAVVPHVRICAGVAGNCHPYHDPMAYWSFTT